MIDTATTQPPLRAATVWCIELRPGRAVPPAMLAQMADVEPARARAYASILIARGALIETPAGLVPGPAWDDWRRSPPGRPKRAMGDAKASNVMDDMRRAMAANIRDMTTAKGWSKAELARRAGIDHRALSRTWLRADPLTAAAVVLVARTLGVQVEELVARPASFRA